jgi:hypothetical protein
MEQVRYKCQLAGIQILIQEESYTSSVRLWIRNPFKNRSNTWAKESNGEHSKAKRGKHQC